MKQSLVNTLQGVESQPYVFREAKAEEAIALVSCYESVFGAGGIRAPGYEPYPAPEVFYEAGVIEIIQDPSRQLMVMETGKEIAAAMIISHNSQFHREFGCVAVADRYKGLGISSLMLKEAKKLEQQEILCVNITEIVTHSMLSQSAHKSAGYGQITGFGYCQYPKVFFANHPESCIWVTSFEGRLIEYLRQARLSGDTTQTCPPGSQQDGNSALFEQSSVAQLRAPRSIFVPQGYLSVVTKIAAQYRHTFDYRIFAETQQNQQVNKIETTWQVNECADSPYAYIDLPNRSVSEVELHQQVCRLMQKNKRHIQVRVSTRNDSAIDNITMLKNMGFVLLGWVPFFRLADDAHPDFDDVFIMQHLKPEVVSANALPGETESVIKLRGYPENVSGDIIATIRRDLKNARTRIWSEQ